MKKYFTAKNIALLLAVALVIFFLYKCPFVFFFGIPCPGCGMTRALKSVLMLQFKQAFYYHPLYPLVILLFIAGLLEYFKVIKVSEKVGKWILGISIALFLLVYILRWIYGSSIVCFTFSDSLIYKLLIR